MLTLQPLQPVQTLPRDASCATASPAARSTEPARALDGAGSGALVPQLAWVVVEAGTCHLDDQAAWQRLTAEARDIVGRLIERGAAPPHLRIHDGEPAVVVRRTLAAVWRHTSGGARLT